MHLFEGLKKNVLVVSDDERASNRPPEVSLTVLVSCCLSNAIDRCRVFGWWSTCLLCAIFGISMCACAVLVSSYFIICVIHISCRHVYGQRFENNMILIGLLICDHKLLFAYDAENSGSGRAPLLILQFCYLIVRQSDFIVFL